MQVRGTDGDRVGESDVAPVGVLPRRSEFLGVGLVRASRTKHPTRRAQRGRVLTGPMGRRNPLTQRGPARPSPNQRQPHFGDGQLATDSGRANPDGRPLGNGRHAVAVVNQLKAISHRGSVLLHRHVLSRVDSRQRSPQVGGRLDSASQRGLCISWYADLDHGRLEMSASKEERPIRVARRNVGDEYHPSTVRIASQARNARFQSRWPICPPLKQRRVRHRHPIAGGRSERELARGHPHHFIAEFDEGR